MTRIKDIIQYLETIAPPSLQESYDNSQLITGNLETEVTGVLITLDTTEAVVDEAINMDCNLIISHHPIVFKGLKSFTGKTYVERTVIQAIKRDIAIYAIHTNLDNVQEGVNKKICDKLGLINTQILSPKSSVLSKLVTFVPSENLEKVKDALFNAGAGNIGNYSDCSFSINGEGQFKPNKKANPNIGSAEELEKVNEIRLEVLVPSYLKNKVLKALREAHPYEEVAYYLNTLDNAQQDVGSGMMGELTESISSKEYLEQLKSDMNLNVIRHTHIVKKKIKKIAVCGGAGSFLLKDAINAGADLFVSSDFKYHEFFDAEDKIIIADIGHYESEVYTKELIYEFLSEKFNTFALNLSKTVTNPISYL